MTNDWMVDGARGAGYAGTSNFEVGHGPGDIELSEHAGHCMGAHGACLVVRRLRPTALLCVLSLWALAYAVRAEDQVLRLAVAPGGFPPFIISTAGQPAGGLMVDVLREIAAQSGYRIVEVETPRKRSDPMMLAGDIDVVPRAREWTAQPQKFLFTEPVLRVRDVIFARKSAPVNFESPEDLLGMRVGTHLGYRYPALEAYFNMGTIRREDAFTEEAMLRMLQAERTDVAVLAEPVGLWLIKQLQWEGQFSYAPNELDGYDYRFMLGPNRSELVARLDRELARMKRDGRLARIIAKYRSTPR